MPRRFARLTPLLCLLAVLLALPALAPGAATAATVVPLTLEELEGLSSDIVVGTVLNTKAAWDENHRIIETTVRLRVDRRVKGARARGQSVIIVVVPGGIVGDVGMKQPGSAVFIGGEQVLLFAEPGRSKKLRPVGMFQGKMRVQRDEARGADMVVPSGPAWGAQGKPIASGTNPGGPPPPLPLEEVLERLGADR